MHLFIHHQRGHPLIPFKPQHHYITTTMEAWPYHWRSGRCTAVLGHNITMVSPPQERREMHNIFLRPQPPPQHLINAIRHADSTYHICRWGPAGPKSPIQGHSLARVGMLQWLELTGHCWQCVIVASQAEQQQRQELWSVAEGLGFS